MVVTGRTLGRLRSRGERFFFARQVLLPSARYIRVQEIAGGPLIAAAAAALFWANFAPESYGAVWDTKVTLELFVFSRTASISHWISDLLLPIFFFAAGLEIKREIVHGELSSWRHAALPVVAAIGGMAAPALVFIAMNAEEQWRGWGIPVATDIAFALAILGVLGKRVPQELRVFVLAFAAADDLGGVLVIAFFYSHGIEWGALGVGAGLLVLMMIARAAGIRAIPVYLGLGSAFLLAVMEGGIHPTVAGVVMGLMAPATSPVDHEMLASRLKPMSERILEVRNEAEESATSDEDPDTKRRRERAIYNTESRLIGELELLVHDSEPPTERLIDIMNPLSSYVVLPVFAISHAGVAVDMDMLGSAAGSAVAWGVFIALVVGKPVGIVGLCWAAVKLGVARLPGPVNLGQLAGAGFVAGIGFTISLFIAELAFSGDLLREAKFGVLVASIAAAVLGAAVLVWAGRGRRYGED